MASPMKWPSALTATYCLALPGPKFANVLTPRSAQQLQRVGAAQEQVGHVVRLVEQHARGPPGVLLRPPVGELRRDREGVRAGSSTGAAAQPEIRRARSPPRGSRIPYLQQPPTAGPGFGVLPWRETSRAAASITPGKARATHQASSQSRPRQMSRLAYDHGKTGREHRLACPGRPGADPGLRPGRPHQPGQGGRGHGRRHRRAARRRRMRLWSAYGRR